jgi:predicted metalloendopeptidase
MLRFPLFDESYPMYLNFASLGFLLGHELAHGLDSIGRYFDKDGDISSWWPQEAEASFNTKAACFADQYGKFKIPQVDEFVDGYQTLGDNISDNVALRISWLAYKMWAQDHNMEELPLPGTNFTVSQIFYVTFSQIWCESLSKEDYYQKYIGDVHSPGQFRVVGVVQNDAEFGDIFDCPRGTPMNPTHKCTLW